MSQPPSVDIAIVNWNTTDQAVHAAREYGRSAGVEANVVVVDNASEPQQRRLLAEAATGSGFELIENPVNLGFGHAANLGLSNGTSDYVLVSNADVAPDENAVAAMTRIAADPEVGMVGPVFDLGTGNYHDRIPGAGVLMVRILVGGFSRKRIEPPPPGVSIRVEQPSGACFLMRRELWQRLGGFDEEYFLWYEDVDLARRIADMGKFGVVSGDARVAHQGGESFAKIDDREKQRIRLSSLRRYLEQHHRFAAKLARPLFRLSLRVRVGSGPDGS